MSGTRSMHEIGTCSMHETNKIFNVICRKMRRKEATQESRHRWEEKCLQSITLRNGFSCHMI
jgi:hypothetical protein